MVPKSIWMVVKISLMVMLFGSRLPIALKNMKLKSAASVDEGNLKKVILS
jgi:hypothetical protein